MALKRVYDLREEEVARRWLSEKIDRLNAPHFSRNDKRPYTVEDFTRPAESNTEQIQRDFAFMKMSRALAGITKDSEPPTSWAKVQWKPEDYPEMFNLKKQ